jgi:hypothetical protein
MIAAFDLPEQDKGVVQIDGQVERMHAGMARRTVAIMTRSRQVSGGSRSYPRAVSVFDPGPSFRGDERRLCR